MEGGRKKPAVYGECRRNHAARLGKHATDGCLEYLQDTINLQSLYCVACACHRNFHLKITMPNKRRLSGRNAIERGGSSSNRKGSRGNTVLNTQLSTVHELEVKMEKIHKVYTPFQEQHMWELAERLNWKMPDFNEIIMAKAMLDFIGIRMESFQSWMENQKKNSISDNERKPLVPDMN
ncbi:hypothetical protein IFM89_010892 [Coptis chinensis]|uniref:ZF-HD dimerization-type domain-containing protein n=1 Tax=Coptis chinensis TaxID=261450 RepID=A0A835HZ28_9MAGN|nr:hypothetical protein IFM89_010892 [Coptis chinensis]